MISKKIGIGVLAVGSAYLVLIAWLLSWWIVPGYREHGSGLLSYLRGTEALGSLPFGRYPGHLEPSSPLWAPLSPEAYRHCDWRFLRWVVSSSSHGSPSFQSRRTIPVFSALAGG